MATVDVDVRDRAAYLPRADALVLADLHLGRGAASGVEFPLREPDALSDRLRALLDAFEPGDVVLAGDVLHSFSHLPLVVEDAFDAIVERVRDSSADLTVIEGNHDTMLGELVEPVAEHRLADGTIVCHGHEEPDGDAPRYVIGHDHPAIVIEGRRHPCYLQGRGAFRGADVLCLPAFDEYAAGTALNGSSPGDVMSPLLAELDRFRPIVRDDEAEETFVFPPLGEFRTLL